MAEDSAVPLVHAETRAEWRAWLAAHHADATGAWLVSWRSGVGRPAVGYEDSVREALCFGWVDSKGKKLDEKQTMLYFAPRRSRSGWSRSNKQRVEQLIADGRMRRAGLRMVELARTSGTWTALDSVEDLIVPPDLEAAFDRHPGARGHWDAFPRSVRRGILEWVLNAKRAPTREKRIEETAAMAARNERANQWR